ncbi:hypothetical protein MMJ50_11690 [Enterococcus cecorum]|uniref:hypothetical protein n=1 Tax=Enterococcus cecorum TaxID=44008 RepID=UPI001FAD14D5|nr:hypothetical protein [Enterococcus cecorum]MCJ0593326.1 hypothetical protein [Enterococcus cecorum]
MSEDKNKKLKNWIKVAMSLYVLAFVVGIGLNINNTVSKAEQLENTAVSYKKPVETTNTLENISKENIEATTETTKQEEKQGKDSSVKVIGTIKNTTDSTKQEEKAVESNVVSEAKQTEVAEVKQAQATNTYTEEQTKQEDNSNEILEDVLETKYNASNFEEDHSKECALDAQMYNDNFCEGFYKLIDKTASEKALRAYMLDYHVFDYFGVDSATNTLNVNTAYLADGSIATSTDTAIYREFNGKKTKLLDVNNNPNHYYFENGFYINNRGIIFRTTISKTTKTLIIPNKISGITVKGIDGAVFRDYNFTSVSLPDSIEIIGHEEFYNSTFTTFKRPKNLKYTAHNMFNPKMSVTIIN